MKYRAEILMNCRFALWAIIVFSCTGHDEDRIENVITSHIINAIDDGYCVGTAVVFYDDGSERYFSYGFTDTTHKNPISKKSVFEIGSISKTFTSLILADLVEKGKMRLADPVDQYLPDSVRMPLVAGNRITLADLASHTSGLPRMPSNFNPKDSTNPYADYTIRDLFTFLDNIHFRNSNKHYEYSNLAVGLLGVAEMHVTGKTYNQLVQDIICKPLGMTETSTLNTSPLLTTGHRGTYPVNHWDLNALIGAGGIRSNTDDLLRYLKAQMGLTKSELLPAMKLTQKPLHDVGNKMKVGLGWHFTFTG